MQTKNNLEKKMEDVISESMKSIIGDNAKDEVRRLLKEAEDEDSFEEEDVKDDTADTDDVKVSDTIDTDKGGDVADGEDSVDDIDNIIDSDEDDTTSEDEDGIWDELEQCKSADGEFDCRGMDDDKLLKVLKAMGPEDGIRVMKNDDGSIGVQVDGNVINDEEEFVIIPDEIPDSSDYSEEGGVYNSEDYSDDYDDFEADDTASDEYESDDDMNEAYSVDTDDDDDENMFEIELHDSEDDEDNVNEIASTTENNPAVRGTAMTHANTNLKGKTFRSSSEGGARVKGTGENSYSANESIEFKRKMNKLYEENKQMKSIIPELNKKLMESMVINASMGYIVRLLNENTTTVDEKREISARFTKVNTLDESKRLYESISKELKRVNKNNNVQGIFNSQLAEGKQSDKALIETTMYRSDKVNEALDFMKRLSNIK